MGILKWADSEIPRLNMFNHTLRELKWTKCQGVYIYIYMYIYICVYIYIYIHTHTYKDFEMSKRKKYHLE